MWGSIVCVPQNHWIPACARMTCPGAGITRRSFPTGCSGRLALSAAVYTAAAGYRPADKGYRPAHTASLPAALQRGGISVNSQRQARATLALNHTPCCFRQSSQPSCRREFFPELPFGTGCIQSLQYRSSESPFDVNAKGAKSETPLPGQQGRAGYSDKNRLRRL